jgi:hypothetical protein
LTDDQNENQEAKSTSSDSTVNKNRASSLQRLGALMVTLIALWYLFGIPGYILFEKFLGTDAAEMDTPQAAPE